VGDIVAFPVRQKNVTVERGEIVAMIHFHTALAIKSSDQFHKAMAEHLCIILTELDQNGRSRSLGGYRR